MGSRATLRSLAFYAPASKMVQRRGRLGAPHSHDTLPRPAALCTPSGASGTRILHMCSHQRGSPLGVSWLKSHSGPPSQTLPPGL